jgi:hypothetical protein
MHSDFVTIAGTNYRLFDLGGLIAVAALVVTFIVSVSRNTRALYLAEPLPSRTTTQSIRFETSAASLSK